MDISKDSIYKNKKTKEVVYLFEVNDDEVVFVTIRSEKFNILRAFCYLEKDVFFENYERYIDNSHNINVILEYFSKVLVFKKYFDESKIKEENVLNFISKNQLFLSDFETHENNEFSQCNYYHNEFHFTKKHDLSAYLKISVSTLNNHIEKNNLNHFLLTHEDVEKIIFSVSEYKKKTTYEFKDVRAESVQVFLHRLGIPYSKFTKWKKETGYNKQHLTKPKFVEELLAFSKDKTK